MAETRFAYCPEKAPAENSKHTCRLHLAGPARSVDCGRRCLACSRQGDALPTPAAPRQIHSPEGVGALRVLRSATGPTIAHLLTA